MELAVGPLPERESVHMSTRKRKGKAPAETEPEPELKKHATTVDEETTKDHASPSGQAQGDDPTAENWSVYPEDPTAPVVEKYNVVLLIQPVPGCGVQKAYYIQVCGSPDPWSSQQWLRVRFCLPAPQLLHGSGAEPYIVMKRWGRVGGHFTHRVRPARSRPCSTPGTCVPISFAPSQVHRTSNEAEAIELFTRTFREKTGIEWAQRSTHDWTAHPAGKYSLVSSGQGDTSPGTRILFLAVFRRPLSSLVTVAVLVFSVRRNNGVG